MNTQIHVNVLVTHLHSGPVELNVMEFLFVARHFTLQFVHSHGLLSERVQLVTVRPQRTRVTQQLQVLTNAHNSQYDFYTS